MKIIATIGLACVVLVAGFLCFCFSLCAVTPDPDVGGSRITYALLDILDIGIMIGAVMLIAKLNRRK